MNIRVGIITISDRSSQGQRPDVSGPALADAIHKQKWVVAKTAIIPDEFDQIHDLLMSWSEGDQIDIILTTGGTGLAPRDHTPEATQSVIERAVPGISEAMRAASLIMNPHAMISRGISGIRKRTLIINLPGSPKAAVENLDIVLSVLPHAVQLLREDPAGEGSHHLIKE